MRSLISPTMWTIALQQQVVVLVNAAHQRVLNGHDSAGTRAVFYRGEKRLEIGLWCQLNLWEKIGPRRRFAERPGVSLDGYRSARLCSFHILNSSSRSGLDICLIVLLFPFQIAKDDDNQIRDKQQSGQVKPPAVVQIN